MAGNTGRSSGNGFCFMDWISSSSRAAFLASNPIRILPRTMKNPVKTSMEAPPATKAATSAIHNLPDQLLPRKYMTVTSCWLLAKAIIPANNMTARPNKNPATRIPIHTKNGSVFQPDYNSRRGMGANQIALSFSLSPPPRQAHAAAAKKTPQTPAVINEAPVNSERSGNQAA